MKDGKLIIFSAPSGAGKTTIVKEILKDKLPLEFSISACNRKAREGEVDGSDYYFLSTEDFQTKIENEEFIEWEEVYEGRYYGTLKSELDRIWTEDKHVLFDIDVVGGTNLKRLYGEKALAIFIQPPSVEELRRRLVGRATDDTLEIDRRVAKAEKEMGFAKQFDLVIVNDILEDAIVKTKQAIVEFLS